MAPEYRYRQENEKALQESMNGAFQVAGFSYPAGERVKFLADFVYSDGKNVNWRERLVCPKTGLNNRQRAAVHIMDSELGVIPQESVYITEQVTSLYNFLLVKHPGVIGSEFLGASIPRGSFDKKGVRNEDLTKLTFENDTFGAILSFDCFEHMPDFATGMKEGKVKADDAEKRRLLTILATRHYKNAESFIKAAATKKFPLSE